MISWIEYLFIQGSKLSGLDLDNLKLLFTFFSSYVFAAILKRFPDNSINLKEIYCILISFFYLIGIWSHYYGLFTILLDSSFTYLLAYNFRKSWYMPWTVLGFCMIHLCSNHIQRQINLYYYPNSDNADITGAHMVLVMKLSSFAWNIYDGTLPTEDLSTLNKSRALKKIPSLLDFFAFVFFFPSLLIGPSFDYSEFKSYIDLSMYQDDNYNKDKNDNDNNNKNNDNDNDNKNTNINNNITHAKRNTIKKRTIPRNWHVALRKLVCGITWLILWLKASDHFSIDYLYTKNYANLSFLSRIFYLWPLGLTYRFKYYGAWYMSESSCIMSGISYNGKDSKGRNKWNRVTNVKPFKFETAQSVYGLASAWNINTNHWLKNYVYLRVTAKGKRPGFLSTLITFMVSAFWHGTMPGYYLMFVTFAFLLTASRITRRLIRPFFLSPDLSKPGRYKTFYDIVGYIFTQLAVGYIVQPFMALKFSNSIKIWSSVYFYIHIIIFLIIGFAFTPFRSKLQRKINKRKNLASSVNNETEKDKNQNTVRFSLDENTNNVTSQSEKIDSDSNNQSSIQKKINDLRNEKRKN